MRIALAQMVCESGAIARNVASMRESIRRAADAGYEMVVFPEMADTGYVMADIVRTASPWTGGPCIELAGAAAEHRIAVVAGLSERTDAGIANSTAVLDSAGRLVAKYRKIHLFTSEPVVEHQYLLAGNEPVLFTLGGFRFGLMTCYDLRFPELARTLALRGAEALIVPAAFPIARIAHWSILATARAIENQVYVAAVNRVGTDGGITFGGSSRLLDPAGAVLASANESDEVLIGSAIDRPRLDAVRGGIQVFRDRRPEVYGERWQT
jgi:omega-amidase